MKKYTIETTITIKESESKYSEGTEIFEASIKTRTTIDKALIKDECLGTIQKAYDTVKRAVIIEPEQPVTLPSEPLPEIPVEIEANQPTTTEQPFGFLP